MTVKGILFIGNFGTYSIGGAKCPTYGRILRYLPRVLGSDLSVNQMGDNVNEIDLGAKFKVFP